jgi:predicted DsbA family dithiol-disulfide isomerase
LDRDAVAAYLRSDTGTEEVRAQIAEAGRRGVKSVPTFVFDDRFAVEGAQEASTFLQVLDQVARA